MSKEDYCNSKPNDEPESSQPIDTNSLYAFAVLNGITPINRLSCTREKEPLGCRRTVTGQED